MFDFLAALDESDSMLSVRQVAKMLGFHPNTVHKMVSKREIPSVLISGSRLFDPMVLYWWYAKKHPEAMKARISLSKKERPEAPTRPPNPMPGSACPDRTPQVYSRKGSVYPNRGKTG